MKLYVNPNGIVRGIVKVAELNVHTHEGKCETCQSNSVKIKEELINDNGYKLTLASCGSCIEMLAILIKTRLESEFNGSLKKMCLKYKTVEEQLDWYLNTVPYKRTIKFKMLLPKSYYNLEITKPSRDSYHLRLYTLNDNTTACLYCGTLLHEGGMVSNEHIIPVKHHSNDDNTIFGDTCHECNRLRRHYNLNKILKYNHWFLKFLSVNCGGNTNNDLAKFIKSNRPLYWTTFQPIFN